MHDMETLVEPVDVPYTSALVYSSQEHPVIQAGLANTLCDIDMLPEAAPPAC